MAGHSIDEYLETIYFLAFPIGEYKPEPGNSTAIASRVADMLGVSRASAGEMLKRLEAEGLVERGEQKEAILTPTGIERAERVVRKHRLIERFLTEMPVKFETATDDVWVMGALITTGENGLASSFEQVMVPAEGH